jgi:hypothetical protein
MEGRYLREFCRHYEKLGFDEIRLYDNNEYNTPMSELEKEDEATMATLASNTVTVVPWRNKSLQQIPVYNLQLKQLSSPDCWCAFFDADEFLVLKQHEDIKSFIRSVSNPFTGSIAINWYMFGTNGHTTYRPEDVVKRFTTRLLDVDQHVKSIVHTSRASHMHVHNPDLHQGFITVDPNGIQIPSGPFNKAGKADIAVLHHYYTKSIEEFEQKVNRGRADIKNKKSLSELDCLNAATIVDVSAQTPCVTIQMSTLHTHLKVSFENAQKDESKCSQEILGLEGASGARTRHFYNNLLSIKDISYLEIGMWKGSTLCAAMYKNTATVVGIDNWSEFGGPKLEFLTNLNTFKGENNVRIIEEDCFLVDTSTLPKFNVYMYDGEHSEESHYKALTHFISAMDKEFIYVCDDWNWEQVRNGTQRAIRDLELLIVYDIEIRLTNDNSHTPEDHSELKIWHNGMYACLLRKPTNR